MIEAIIFDLGNVFLDLNFEAQKKAFQDIGLKEWNTELQEASLKYELGKIDELEFIETIQKQLPQEVDLITIREAWNAVIVNFPLERLDFLEKLKIKHKLYLLSNTNQTHIDKFEHRVGLTFAREFYALFDKIYFSYEVGMRKPDINLFRNIISSNNLNPKKTLFIDDTLENIEAANSLGIYTWHLQVGKENVTDLLNNNILKLDTHFI